ncbi:MAG TPA: sugar ABC transporter substrate-binding protein, partial [Ktedonobacterales bacterium]|nr:sugar ABC transporter substrate-binding protein [Ktedonobacterales bacterium]
GVVQLTFWSFNPPIQKQVDLFNQTHPKIHVTYHTEPSGFGQYYPKILTAVRAGNAPDVALIEYQYIPTMLSNNALVDISKYGASNVKSQFDPSAWALASQGNGVYGYPQDTGPMALFYNSAIFKRAGINSPPATWDEYAQDAVKIHQLGPNYYITAFPPESTGWFQGLEWQAGAQWFSIDAAKQAWTVGINSAASKQVAGYWQNLLSQGLVSTVPDFSNDWNTGLDKGTIASWVSAVWGQGVISGSAKDTSGQWAVATMPQWNAGATATAMWGGSAISVIGGTKHPAEANEFAQWYLTNQQSLTIGVQDIGWYPSNLQARSTAVNSPNAFYSNQVVDQLFTHETVQPSWLFPPDLTAVTNLQGDGFDAAIANHTSLVDALNHLQTQIVNDLKGNGINVSGS